MDFLGDYTLHGGTYTFRGAHSALELDSSTLCLLSELSGIPREQLVVTDHCQEDSLYMVNHRDYYAPGFHRGTVVDLSQEPFVVARGDPNPISIACDNLHKEIFSSLPGIPSAFRPNVPTEETQGTIILESYGEGRKRGVCDEIPFSSFSQDEGGTIYQTPSKKDPSVMTEVTIKPAVEGVNLIIFVAKGRIRVCTLKNLNSKIRFTSTYYSGLSEKGEELKGKTFYELFREAGGREEDFFPLTEEQEGNPEVYSSSYLSLILCHPALVIGSRFPFNSHPSGCLYLVGKRIIEPSLGEGSLNRIWVDVQEVDSNPLISPPLDQKRIADLSLTGTSTFRLPSLSVQEANLFLNQGFNEDFEEEEDIRLNLSESLLIVRQDLRTKVPLSTLSVRSTGFHWRYEIFHDSKNPYEAYLYRIRLQNVNLTQEKGRNVWRRYLPRLKESHLFLYREAKEASKSLEELDSVKEVLEDNVQKADSEVEWESLNTSQKIEYISACFYLASPPSRSHEVVQFESRYLEEIHLACLWIRWVLGFQIQNDWPEKVMKVVEECRCRQQSVNQQARKKGSSKSKRISKLPTNPVCINTILRSAGFSSLLRVAKACLKERKPDGRVVFEPRSLPSSKR